MFVIELPPTVVNSSGEAAYCLDGDAEQVALFKAQLGAVALEHLNWHPQDCDDVTYLIEDSTVEPAITMRGARLLEKITLVDEWTRLLDERRKTLARAAAAGNIDIASLQAEYLTHHADANVTFVTMDGYIGEMSDNSADPGISPKVTSVTENDPKFIEPALAEFATRRGGTHVRKRLAKIEPTFVEGYPELQEAAKVADSTVYVEVGTVTDVGEFQQTSVMPLAVVLGQE
jgi:hypothetical protein